MATLPGNLAKTPGSAPAVSLSGRFRQPDDTSAAPADAETAIHCRRVISKRHLASFMDSRSVVRKPSVIDRRSTSARSSGRVLTPVQFKIRITSELPHERDEVRFFLVVSFSSRIRLKNSTVSSSVSSRPSWKYGGESLMPRRVNVLIGPWRGRDQSVDHPRLVEPIDLQVVHQVVGVERGRVADGALGLAEEELLAAHRRRFRRELRGVELAEEVQARGRREVEQFLDLRHEVDLAATFQRVDPLGRCRHLVAVEIGRTLLEFGEIFDGLQRPLRAEQPLDVHAAKARGIDATAVRLRPDVARQVGRPGGVAVDVAVEAGHALHAERASVLRSAVALNCCCGNCVTSSRRPSRSLALRIPAKISWKLSTVTILPCETSPRSGRVVR